ncbi:MAG: chemotaxis protein CheW [Myxococcota bacterium]
MAEAQQYCTFYVDEMHLGIEVLKVQEVLRYQKMTRVPLASDVVSGLINLRGQIVTAIDLRKRLGLPPRKSDKRPMNVVIRSDDHAVSLLVDEIGDVMETTADRFERPPQTLNGPSRELFRGVYKFEDSILLVLDTERTLEMDGP